MGGEQTSYHPCFEKLREMGSSFFQNHGPITVFYCGNPHLGKILRRKCEEFGFDFRKEVF